MITRHEGILHILIMTRLAEYNSVLLLVCAHDSGVVMDPCALTPRVRINDEIYNPQSTLP
eukprot:CAMPEP_0202468822 /NCGR_PEP_ID=MMETSP1360-20130828/76589_1 /ASSEMBLY_ACC=CAM_ASM_000848 /TAXON_ID=515479 /ORGANISM="Licmophora paradoxa, Strain CCMP2313" /LENGTH=59 /DNA_ID=CAMNT_0049093927 /DNA_START=208 /DNA_END=384 /DNA_ORIENTATION=-